MTTPTLKVLAQVKPAVTTLVDAYTVPASTQTVISVITIANQSVTNTTVRVSVAVAGAADTPAQYLAFDFPIGGFETLEIARGLTLGAGDIIRVYNTLATVSFNIFGQQNA